MEEPFYVGPWLIEPLINRISDETRVRRVEPKIMDVLVKMCRQPGHVVTREELFDDVWSGTVVTDDVLTRSISELRKALGDDPKQPVFIETIPKTGYRLIAPVGPDSVEYPGSVRPTGDHGEDGLGSGGPLRIVSMRTGLFLLVLILALIVVWLSFPTAQPAVRPLIPEPVTTYPGRESAPKLSPDGRQVAFSWRGEHGDNVDLYVKYVDAAPVLRLTTDSIPERNPAWSPDGTEIAYIARGPACMVKAVSAIGGVSRTLGACGSNIYGDLTWSPDGSWLAFNDRAGPEESFAIYLMHVTTGEKRKLTDPPSGIWGDHDPAFSPDGRKVAFVRSVSEGMQDAYVVDASGSDERRLTSEYRNIWGIEWLTDGRHAVISSNRTGRPALWKLQISKGDLEWMGIQSPAAGFPSIAGNRLAFLQMETDVNIWRVPIDRRGDPRLFAPSTYWDLHPAISPDGSQVAFASNRSGSYEIWVADSAGGSLRQLTGFGGPFTSTPRWSPDGTRLVFTARPSGNADIYVAPVSGSTPSRITDDASDDLAPDWSLDGNSILFTSNRSGSWELWRTDAAGQVAEQLSFSGAFGPRPMRDQTVGFSRPADSGLWSLDVVTGTEREILDHFDPRDWGSWRAFDSGVYFVDRASGANILKLDLAAGSVDTVFRAPNGVPTMDPSLDVSSDERWLLVGQVDRREADIMVVELGMGN